MSAGTLLLQKGGPGGGYPLKSMQKSLRTARVVVSKNEVRTRLGTLGDTAFAAVLRKPRAQNCARLPAPRSGG